jgi:uncharacterized Rmd1/YagE family protein
MFNNRNKEFNKLKLPISSSYGSTNDDIGDDVGVRLQLLQHDGNGNRERSISAGSTLPMGSTFKKNPVWMNDEDVLKTSTSVDEFQDLVHGVGNKIMRTGRQRKKLAARSKGGDFQQKRKKRRVYFCCVGNEIDLDQLHETIIQDSTWEAKMYEDVLHLYMMGRNDENKSDKISTKEIYQKSKNIYIGQTAGEDFSDMNELNMDSHENILSDNENAAMPITSLEETELAPQSAAVLWNSYGREVFIFAFGVAVFWSFHRGEENALIDQIREYVAGGELSEDEYSAGQDDMAFVLSSEDIAISIANDVITLPNNSSAKNRLAVSFAIAQSAVLGIFESRIEKKIEEYKYIPETLAACGKVRLTPKILGTMIGEVYVIRHDVNLHTEILDTPDFFWKEDSVEPLYRKTMLYLEMETRTEILNKRLDMLRELLGVLQQQHENENALKLEVIIIWLIVLSIIVESAQVFIEMVIMK